ncbi:hypothetical protein GJ496_004772 [Pomphorhynchus laevis]|nr:hypothetical protein GJ496_004772 [Pomphorhynchus laevis]
MSANDNTGNEPSDVNDSEVLQQSISIANQQPGILTPLDLNDTGPGSIHEAACHRRVLILRGLPASVPAEEVVNALECYPRAPKLTNITFAGNCHWYLMFESEDDAREANFILNGDIKRICDTPIKACFKHSMPLFQQKQVMESRFRHQQIMSAPASHVPSPTPPYVPVSQQAFVNACLDLKQPTGIIPTAAALNQPTAMYSQFPGHYNLISSAYPIPAAAFNLSAFSPPNATHIFATADQQNQHGLLQHQNLAAAAAGPFAIQLQGHYHPHQLLHQQQQPNQLFQQPLKLHTSRLIERKRASSVQTANEPRNLQAELMNPAYSSTDSQNESATTRTLPDNHYMISQHQRSQQQFNQQRMADDEFAGQDCEVDTQTNTILESKVFTSSKFNPNDCMSHVAVTSSYDLQPQHQQVGKNHRLSEVVVSNRPLDGLTNKSAAAENSLTYHPGAHSISSSINSRASGVKHTLYSSSTEPHHQQQQRYDDQHRASLDDNYKRLAVQHPQFVDVSTAQQVNHRSSQKAIRNHQEACEDKTSITTIGSGSRNQQQVIIPATAASGGSSHYISYAGKLKSGLNSQQQQQPNNHQKAQSSQQRSAAYLSSSGRR